MKKKANKGDFIAFLRYFHRMRGMKEGVVQVIHEDKDYLALNKPQGMLTHGVRGKSFQENTLADWALKHYPEIGTVGDDPIVRPGIVHRLDRNTSGVIVIARNRAFFEYMKQLFSEHKVTKRYLALVHGTMARRGVINTPIGLRSGTTKRSVRAKHMKMVKEAVTEFETIGTFEKNGEKFSAVRLTPKTGRTHQLRVHLASVGHPVVGDVLYGKKKNPWGLNWQLLHAESLEFSSREGRRVRIEADLPKMFKSVLTDLRK